MKLVEKFALQDGYKKANWKYVPVEDDIVKRLGLLESKSETPQFINEESNDEIMK